LALASRHQIAETTVEPDDVPRYPKHSCSVLSKRFFFDQNCDC